MTIGDVARRTGVSIKAPRFYDDLGILDVAGRSESGYRLFGDSVLVRAGERSDSVLGHHTTTAIPPPPRIYYPI